MTVPSPLSAYALATACPVLTFLSWYQRMLDEAKGIVVTVNNEEIRPQVRIGLAFGDVIMAKVLAPYARTVRCPVLTCRMMLSAYENATQCQCQAMTQFPVLTACGGDPGRTEGEPLHRLWSRYQPAYARATQCSVLT
eukprot:2630804-Rhodomonas_salina.2